MKLWRLKLARSFRNLERYREPGAPLPPELRKALRSIVDSLSPDERQALNAAYITTLRMTEGLPEGAIRYSFIGEAVRWKLKKEFDDAQTATTNQLNLLNPSKSF